MSARLLILVLRNVLIKRCTDPIGELAQLVESAIRLHESHHNRPSIAFVVRTLGYMVSLPQDLYELFIIVPSSQNPVRQVLCWFFVETPLHKIKCVVRQLPC